MHHLLISGENLIEFLEHSQISWENSFLPKNEQNGSKLA